MATLWLIGMMGSGKSTVGALVARQLGRTLVDLDDRVCRSAGRPIVDIFAAEGEAGFRRREAEALAAVAGEEVVAACGGGVVLSAANVERMQASGLVVWLDAPVGVLTERVGAGEGRPLLAGSEVGGSLRELAAARAALYAGACHHRVDSGRRTAEEAAGEVVRLWTRYR